MESAKVKILAPLSGEAVALEAVPDEVFARKMLGEGAAIRPSGGRLLSPLSGRVISVARTMHAYGFASDDGVEVLVHVGLDTAALAGEGFRALVKEGDAVRAGDPVAEIDWHFLAARGVNCITPVVIAGAGGYAPKGAVGGVRAGRDPIVTLTENPAEEPAGGRACGEAPARRDGDGGIRPGAVGNEKRRRGRIRFDLLQKLGKVLMTVIAVMPAAGFLLSLGKLIQMSGAGALMVVGGVMESIGWAIINNLHVLFAVAIGGSWARERAGGAFAALIAFVVLNRMTGAVFGVTEQMLADPDASVRSLTGRELPVEGYFTSVLGAPALNMGVFVGIIAGFLGGMVYNRYYNYRKLPDALAFFNGKRFVPMAVIFYTSLVSLVMAAVWPAVQSGINAFGVWIAGSAQTFPVLAPFVYGTMERLLLPFGLHHMLTIPMNYTAFGGSYVIRTGVNAGATVFGQDPLWLAWVTDLIHFRDAGNMAAFEHLAATVTPARFKAGQIIGSCGLLMGFALAMYRRAEPHRREGCRSMLVSAALAVFLTGVTEPVEFLFMFCAPALYLAYALLQGLAFAAADIVPLRLHAFGGIELAARIPMSVRAGLGGDLANLLVGCAAFLAVGYGVAWLMIGRFGYATPGRLDNACGAADADGTAPAGTGSARAERIIALLGGKENIVLADACMTRLRVTVRDPARVADADAWKAEGALGLVRLDEGVQAVFGPGADVIKSDINDILQGG